MKLVVFGSLAGSLVNFRGALIAEAVRRGHNVVACAPGASREIVERLQGMGARYKDIPLQRTGLNPVEDIYTLARLRDFFRKTQPDVLLGYTIKPVIYGSLAGKGAGIPKICSMITGLGYAYGQHDWKARIVHRIVERLYRVSLKHNHRVFFQNPDDLKLFADQGFVDQQQCVLVNGSGVDLQHFEPRPLPSDISFLLIARLIRAKGIGEYAEAAGILKRKYKNVSFRIVGGIDRRNPAAIMPDQLGKWMEGGSIEYCGEMADVREAISASSVYVLPSYREGTPRTVLEAMSMGRPIITTDVPGCRETVCEGLNGFLVPPRNAAALAGAMETFILNPEYVSKMGENSRKIAIEKYDVHKVNSTILSAIGI